MPLFIPVILLILGHVRARDQVIYVTYHSCDPSNNGHVRAGYQVMYATYHLCDRLILGQVRARDQVIFLNHKILATDTILYKIKLIGDPKCTFCNKTDGTSEHLLWECECVKRL